MDCRTKGLLTEQVAGALIPHERIADKRISDKRVADEWVLDLGRAETFDHRVARVGVEDHRSGLAGVCVDAFLTQGTRDINVVRMTGLS